MEADPTLVLLEWGRSRRMIGQLVGSELDRIGARCPVPVVGATLSQVPAGRVVLVTGRDDGSTGYSSDLEVARQIAVRVAREGSRELKDG